MTAGTEKQTLRQAKRRALRAASAIVLALTAAALVWACPAADVEEAGPDAPDTGASLPASTPGEASAPAAEEGGEEPASKAAGEAEPESEAETGQQLATEPVTDPDPAPEPAAAPGAASEPAAPPDPASDPAPGSTPSPAQTPAEAASTPAPHVHALATREVRVGTRDTIEHVPGHTETIHHDEAWSIRTEQVWVCNGADGGGCGAILRSQAEITAHMKETGHNGWYSDQVITEEKLADAYDEEVWVDAHDEVVGWHAVYVQETYCTACGEVVERSEEYAH